MRFMVFLTIIEEEIFTIIERPVRHSNLSQEVWIAIRYLADHRNHLLKTQIYLCVYIYNVNFVCHVQMSKHMYKKPSQDNGPFSCDVRDIHKDIFEGKPTQNLNFK